MQIIVFIMLGYILFIIGAVSLLLYYFIFVKPQKLIKQYKKKFQSQGYRVFTLPISPLNFASLKLVEEGFKKYDNCMKQFINLSQYDVVLGNLLTGIQIRLLSPQLMQQLCNKERQWNYQKYAPVMQFIERATGKGLVGTEGELWKNKRKTINSVFNFNFVAGLTSPIQDKCLESLELHQKDNNHDGKYVYSIMSLCTEIASSVIFTGFLGGNLKDEKIQGKNPTKEWMQIVDLTVKQFEDPVSVILGLWFLAKGLRKKDRDYNERLKVFNGWALDYIRKRNHDQMKRIEEQKQSYVPKDIISAMIHENYKTKGDQSYQYSQLNLVSELKTFFIAGTDTTSHMLQIMIYYVFKDQKIEKKLREQISQKVIGDNFTYEDIKNMKYLQAIQKEAIRLVGPGNQIFPRVVVKDHYLKGVEVRKGCILNSCSVTVHNSADYYQEPSKFLPERWLTGQCDKLHPFALNGFHGGSRSCIGKHLSLLQSKIALIMFTLRYKKVQILCKKLIIQFGFVFGAQDFKVKVQK